MEIVEVEFLCANTLYIMHSTILIPGDLGVAAATCTPATVSDAQTAGDGHTGIVVLPCV